MNDQTKSGLTDDELAVEPTVFAPDALNDQVFVVSGGAGGIGRAVAWLFARLGAMSPLSIATRASSMRWLPVSPRGS